MKFKAVERRTKSGRRGIYDIGGDLQRKSIGDDTVRYRHNADAYKIDESFDARHENEPHTCIATIFYGVYSILFRNL